MKCEFCGKEEIVECCTYRDKCKIIETRNFENNFVYKNRYLFVITKDGVIHEIPVLKDFDSSDFCQYTDSLINREKLKLFYGEDVHFCKLCVKSTMKLI